jgi:oligoendopeptidase F
MPAATRKSRKPAPRKTKSHLLPPRSKVAIADQWDLTQLFASDAAWEKDFEQWQADIEKFAAFKGSLSESPATLAQCLRFDADFDRRGERLGNYAALKASGDQSDSVYQRMKGRFHHAAVKSSEAASFIRPEILAIAPVTLDQFLQSPELAEWKLAIERIVRYRPHTLTNHEEEILAMSGQMSDASNVIFRQLNDTDLKWPTLKDEKGVSVELGHSSLSKFLQSPKRDVRKKAFLTYYAEYDRHRHTIAASYNAAVQRDVFYAKVRNHAGARDSSLFQDNVPAGVYDSLIAAVHKHLPTNHRYLALRKRALKIPDVHMYDTYVPIVSGIQTHYT